MRRLFDAAVLALMALGGAVGAVQASEPVCMSKKVVCYETVTEYVTYRVPYEKAVTKYDHCGHPCLAYVTCYRLVQVPEQNQVRVTKWVKVCYDVKDLEGERWR